MKLTTFTSTGSKGSMTAPAELFEQPVNQQLLSQAVNVYLSNLRQGSASTKTRSQVKRTKSKWFRQKGTGNARHGSRNAPIFVGGGVAHGPRGIENWRKELSQKQKRQAVVSALSAQAENIVVCDSFEKLSGKTKEAVQILTSIGLGDQRVLIVVDNPDEMTIKSVRNLPNVLLTRARRLNALELAMANKVVMTKPALKTLEQRLVTKKEAKASVSTKKETASKEKTSKSKMTKPKTASKSTKSPAASPKKSAAAKPKKTATKKTSK